MASGLVRPDFDAIKSVLRKVQLREKFITDQTVICVLALMDTTPGRENLLGGKATLRDGARINNILNFARSDLRRTVAENTRESYRKASLKPLQEAGIVIQHQTSINDPNTWYELNATLYAILSERDPVTQDALIKVWNSTHAELLAKLQDDADSKRLAFAIDDQEIKLSPGKHNELIRSIVEQFAPSFVPGFIVLYLGDAESKMLFLNKRHLKALGIALDKHDKLPDLILYTPKTNIIYVIEAVSSVGPISDSRMAEIKKVLARSKKISFGLVMGTAFPDRKTFRKFVEDIAWNTFVWIASEDFGIIYFDRRGRRP